MYTRCFGWGNVRERDNLEDVGVNGRIILEWSVKKLGVKTRIGLNWLRKGKHWHVRVSAVVTFFPKI
jgi:hypothetical protein